MKKCITVDCQNDASTKDRRGFCSKCVTDAELKEVLLPVKEEIFAPSVRYEESYSIGERYSNRVIEGSAEDVSSILKVIRE